MQVYPHLFAGGSYTDGSSATGNTASIGVSAWIGIVKGSEFVPGRDVPYTTGLLLTAERQKIKEMKTVVTFIDTVRVSMDDYKDVRTSRIFDDSSTLLDIKKWWQKMQGKTKMEIENIGISIMEISDLEE